MGWSLLSRVDQVQPLPLRHLRRDGCAGHRPVRDQPGAVQLHFAWPDLRRYGVVGHRAGKDAATPELARLLYRQPPVVRHVPESFWTARSSARSLAALAASWR